MKTKRTLTSALLPAIVTLAIGLSGCDKAATVTSDTEVPRIVSEEIPIGVVVALTGHHAEPYGLPMQRGFELAREEINNIGDVGLRFITVDDMSTPDGAKAAVQRLVDRKVPAIVGLAISTHLKEAAPIAQKNRVIAFSSVSSAAGLGRIGDFVFRSSLVTNISIPDGLMATQEKLGYEKVATIYDEIDLYSRSSNEVLRTVLGENRIEILTEEAFKPEIRIFLSS